MDLPNEPESPSLLSIIVFVVLIASTTIVPWLLHFSLGWWAGIPAWLGLAAIYDKLFVPKDSLCMGIPFAFPLSSFILLVGLNLVELIRWLISLTA